MRTPGMWTAEVVHLMISTVKDSWENTRVASVAITNTNRQDFGVSWSSTLDSVGYGY